MKMLRLSKVNCDYCNGSDNKKLFSMPDLRFRNFTTEYNVVQCKNCGHRYLSPAPIYEDLHLLYSNEYYKNREETNWRQKHTYAKRREVLTKNKGKILDIGCAGGAWLSTLGKQWDTYGADFMKSDYRAHNVKISIGQLQEIGYKENFFDIVTAWGLMEHVYNPSMYFAEVHRILKNDGEFIFLVPNGDSLWSRWAYKEDIPRHLHFFRKKTITQYAEKYGFKVMNISFPNDIYSKPATGRGLFKRNLLLKTGLSWKQILEKNYGSIYKIIGKIGSFLDFTLIHPFLEEALGLGGNMLVVLEKIKQN